MGSLLSDTATKPQARMSDRRPSLFAIALFTVFVLSCGDKNNGDTPPDGGNDSATTAVVGPEGGEVEDVDSGVRLLIPAGALDEELEVSIEIVEPPDGSPEAVRGATFELQPEGVPFAEPVVLEVRYDDASLADAVEEDALRIHVWSSGEWEMVEGASVDAVSNVLRAELEHFSIYAPRMGTAVLSITPESQSFGSLLPRATSPPTSFTVTNDGAGVTDVAAVTVAGAHAADFTISDNACLGASLGPGESCVIDVQFAPIAAGERMATLTVETEGEGAVAADLLGVGDTAAQLRIAPSSHVFGAVDLGAGGGPAVFTVTNIGGAPSGNLTVAINGDPQFTIVAQDCAGTPLSGTTVAPNNGTVGNFCTVSVEFAPDVAGTATAELIVTAMPGGSVTAALSGEGIAPAATQTAPATHDFGTVVVGATSVPVTVTLTNAGSTPTGAPTVALSGPDSVEFAIQDDGCTAPLPGGASCTISVVCAPTSVGAKAATLEVGAMPGGTTHTTLACTSIERSTLTISPATHDFGAVVPGTSSSAVPYTVQNTGGAQAGAVTVALNGADAADFALITDGCTGRTIPGGGSCTFAVAFAPQDAGAKTASVSVSATPGGSASAAVSGTGLRPATLTVAPAAHDFGDTVLGVSSTSTILTVQNVGDVPTGVLSTAVGGTDGAEFTVASDACDGTTLAPSASCTIAVNFSPTTAGPKAADVVVAATPGGSVMTSLSGNGLTPAALDITPAAADLGTVFIGSMTSAVFTVRNSGSAPAGTLSASVSGADAAEFAIIADTCSGAALAGGASCSITVELVPTSAGAKSASLNVSASNGESVGASIAGESIEPAVLTISPFSRYFGGVEIGSASGNLDFTIENVGGTPSGPISLAIGGTDAVEFNITADPCSGVNLAVGATCVVSLSFTPVSAGARAASLEVSASPGGTASSDLQGTGLAPAALAMAPAAQSFPDTVVGVVSTTVMFTVDNTGDVSSGTITTALTGADASEFTVTADSCDGAPLAGGASCTVTVRFEPTSAGDKTAALVVSATTGGSASSDLSGTGLTPATLSIAPSAQNFGTVMVGQSSSTVSFVVTNTGQAPSASPMVSLTGADFTDFQIQTNNCTSSLSPGASCTVGVRCSPMTTGSKSASLSVSATPGGVANAALSCSGI